MNAVKTAPSLGRPKDLVKRMAILEAARIIFLQKGFEHSSMDAIAKEAGVSKLTVYNHFHDKENLFVSAVGSYCEDQMPQLEFDLKTDISIEQALLQIATRFQHLIYSDAGLELHRLMCSLTQKNPSLVNRFYQAGPARVLNLMTQLLAKANEQGKLDIPDCKMAAEHFLSLFSGCVHMRVLFEIEQSPTDEQHQKLAEQAVKRFIRAYQPVNT